MTRKNRKRTAKDLLGEDRDPPAVPRTAARLLLQYARPHLAPLILGTVLSLLCAATGLLLPLAAKRLIENLADHEPIALMLVLLTALVCANAGIEGCVHYLLSRTGESVVLNARRRLAARILRLDLTGFDRVEPGDLIARVSSDTTLLRQVIAASFVGGIVGVLTLGATFTMMAVLDPVLLLVTLALLGLAAFALGIVMPRINRAVQASQDSVGLIGAALERLLGGFRTIKASGAEDREHDRILHAAESVWRESLRGAKWSAVSVATAGFSAQIVFLSVLALGGARVASGAMDVGTLIAFLLYIYYLITPMNQLVVALVDYQSASAALVRIGEVDLLPVEHDESGSIAPLSEKPATVEFRRVCHRRGDAESPIHHDVSFSVPSGGMVAFVGPSGAGKTTVFSLIERFAHADSGQVLVDGTDVRDWPLAELRAAIGYVEQDAPVLAGTLRDNLLLAAPDAGAAEIQEVIEATRLDRLVAALPDGLDTEVGHRGARLSGGERQRISIARALLRRPRLLLLDEATSQLDAVNEEALRGAVETVARTTTVLVVAHRLSTVVMADQIIYMEAGRVVATGSHTELLDTSPPYRRLAEIQFLDAASGRL